MKLQSWTFAHLVLLPLFASANMFYDSNDFLAVSNSLTIEVEEQNLEYDDGVESANRHERIPDEREPPESVGSAPVEVFPTKSPSKKSSRRPSTSPTSDPTPGPTQDPTPGPTQDPTSSPTQSPTTRPSTTPSPNPTARASTSPSRGVTLAPSLGSTELPDYKCSPDEGGVYGEPSQEKVDVLYYYDLTILSEGESVLMSEILPDVENAVLENILKLMIPVCSNPIRAMRGLTINKDAIKKSHLRGLHRQRSLNVIGIGSAPQDIILDDGTCASQTDTGTCDVVKAGISFHFDENSADADANAIEGQTQLFIKQQMDAGIFDDGVNEFIVSVRFRDADDLGVPSDTGSSKEQVPIGNPDPGTPTYAYIIVSSCAVMAMFAFLVIRKKKREDIEGEGKDNIPMVKGDVPTYANCDDGEVSIQISTISTDASTVASTNFSPTSSIATTSFDDSSSETSSDGHDNRLVPGRLLGGADEDEFSSCEDDEELCFDASSDTKYGNFDVSESFLKGVDENELSAIDSSTDTGIDNSLVTEVPPKDTDEGEFYPVDSSSDTGNDESLMTVLKEGDNDEISPSQENEVLCINTPSDAGNESLEEPVSPPEVTDADDVSLREDVQVLLADEPFHPKNDTSLTNWSSPESSYSDTVSSQTTEEPCVDTPSNAEKKEPAVPL